MKHFISSYSFFLFRPYLTLPSFSFSCISLNTPFSAFPLFISFYSLFLSFSYFPISLFRFLLIFRFLFLIFLHFISPLLLYLCLYSTHTSSFLSFAFFISSNPSFSISVYNTHPSPSLLYGRKYCF